ncbi:hypothetical protein LINPERHAP1_LOCUS11673, partial [Linum perenne]
MLIFTFYIFLSAKSIDDPKILSRTFHLYFPITYTDLILFTFFSSVRSTFIFTSSNKHWDSRRSGTEARGLGEEEASSRSCGPSS